MIERVIDHPMRQNAGLVPIGQVELFFYARDTLIAHLVLPIAVCFLPKSWTVAVPPQSSNFYKLTLHNGFWNSVLSTLQELRHEFSAGH